MSKRNRETDYAAELERNYARWDEVFTKGGSDPFWSDGVNLGLTRNHILYCKEQLAKQENSLLGLPEAYYRETPLEVDPNYMARPGEIRENARIAQDLKMSRSTVKRALGDLEKAHYIWHERRYRQSGGNSSNLYFVERPP